eukprot:CAMPEP_0174739768 /NCGR_PEP_ID=MMETSP1094-20130205/72154_1 /TAXON_ID=156173 /ORGANISM="Chrysochromulina brevifilum, Strain UTEX LB 985" /LENGTH=265 /DNA_ID=CAMNT_0015943359 /DNA_START=58 /DNA_END=855 /DNA_ORIENTATION=+
MASDELSSHMPESSFHLGASEQVDYVNPVQYNRICRRRAERAVRETIRPTAPRQKYLHESRHNHAINRVRGNKGRFVNLVGDEESPESEAGDVSLTSSYGSVSTVSAASTTGRRGSSTRKQVSNRARPAPPVHTKRIESTVPSSSCADFGRSSTRTAHHELHTGNGESANDGHAGSAKAFTFTRFTAPTSALTAGLAGGGIDFSSSHGSIDLSSSHATSLHEDSTFSTLSADDFDMQDAEFFRSGSVELPLEIFHDLHALTAQHE